MQAMEDKVSVQHMEVENNIFKKIKEEFSDIPDRLKYLLEETPEYQKYSLPDDNENLPSDIENLEERRLLKNEKMGRKEFLATMINNVSLIERLSLMPVNQFIFHMKYDYESVESLEKGITENCSYEEEVEQKGGGKKKKKTVKKVNSEKCEKIALQCAKLFVCKYGDTFYTVDRGGFMEEVSEKKIYYIVKKSLKTHGDVLNRRHNETILLETDFEQLKSYPRLAPYIQFIDGIYDLRRERFLTPKDIAITPIQPVRLNRSHYNLEVRSPYTEMYIRNFCSCQEDFIRMNLILGAAIQMSLGTYHKSAVEGIGPGDSGKTSFKTMLTGMVPGYSTSIPFSCLTDEVEGERASPYRASMRNKIFVVVDEISDTKTLNAEAVKLMIGGKNGEMTSRELFKGPQVFPHVASLFIFGNRDPLIKPTDEALINRIIKVSFGQRFDETHFSPDYEDVLNYVLSVSLPLYNRKGLPKYIKNLESISLQESSEILSCKLFIEKYFEETEKMKALKQHELKEVIYMYNRNQKCKRGILASLKHVSKDTEADETIYTPHEQLPSFVLDYVTDKYHKRTEGKHTYIPRLKLKRDAVYELKKDLEKNMETVYAMMRNKEWFAEQP
ncbi:hypothetical protein GAYE_HTGSCF31FUTG100G0361 [Galdieria yellowstonensis]|uniref:SF3 helicase domain-containing protein n=1 Tax=Galdieria yellowstonensis TaxID=3028027 RepID=A0AAV9I6D6_9RHOD|nr:hypothetical protein GAYE_HTGSCF31FUTG100G0361 [Galdieria yellowstonensis]